MTQFDDGDMFEEGLAELVAVPVDVVDGQGIGDPAGQQGDGEIDAEEEGRDGGDDHMEGERRGKADKYAQAQAAADAAAVEIPQLVGNAMAAEQPDQQPTRAAMMAV